MEKKQHHISLLSEILLRLVLLKKRVQRQEDPVVLNEEDHNDIQTITFLIRELSEQDSI